MSKYNRTFHLPWSPGVSKDDRIATNVNTLMNVPLIISEKLDGSNFCITHDGCFARSHAGPPTHKSFDLAKAFSASVKNKIPKNIMIFMEYTFAKHSIFYSKMQSYFNVFNILNTSDMEWLSWDDVELWTDKIGASTTPVLFKGIVSSEKELRKIVELLMIQPSLYGDIREGIVVRIFEKFKNSEFSQCVMKCVRANHVDPNNDHWLHQEIIKNTKC